jgi:hypothetical protein
MRYGFVKVVDRQQKFDINPYIYSNMLHFDDDIVPGNEFATHFLYSR